MKGKTLVAACPGLTGRISVTVANTLGTGAAASAGTLWTQLRFSQSARRGRLAIPTTQFCRDRFYTDRYRILLTRRGQDIGSATVRVRGPEAQRCRRDNADIDG